MTLRRDLINTGSFWARAVMREGCWGWNGFVDGKGYGRLNVQGARPRSQGAHRASWVLHYGEIPQGMHVLHNCDNPICTNPEHLRLGTHAENMRDMKERNRARRIGCAPERARAVKLGWAEVRAIRKIKADRPTTKNKVIAAMFGVSAPTISLIARGKIWKEQSA